MPGLVAGHPLEYWMRRALDEARAAQGTSDVPVGAIVIDQDGMIIGTGRNTRVRDRDPVGHAEIVALREAAANRRSARLDGCTLIVTLEPCAMCAGAITQSGISRVVYGAADQKAGAGGGGPHDLLRDRSLPHRVDEVIGGVLAGESEALLVEFFRSMRELAHHDTGPEHRDEHLDHGQPTRGVEKRHQRPL